MIRQIQQALQSRGYYKGAIEGKASPEMMTALTLFQNDEQLHIGGLDRETLDRLGVNY